MRTSMYRWISSAIMAAFLMGPVCWLQAQVLVKNRIVGEIRSDRMMVVRGSLHPLVAVARDEGQLPGSYAIQGMSLLFNRSAAQQDDLNRLLAQQQTRGSAMFHHWLTPAQFAARYGTSQSDLQAAAAWLRSQGFTVDQIPPSADRIDFSGTAAQVNAAFHTEMHRYLLRGAEHWANSTELSFPQAIAGMVIGVAHLNTFRPAVSHLKSTPIHLARKPGSTRLRPYYTVTNSGAPVNYLAPADIQTIYDITALYGAGVSGTGQYLGIMGQTDITQYMSDISIFRSLSGLNASNLPTQIVMPGTGSTSGEAAAGAATGDLGESDLDTEWSGAVAKDASIIYVTVGSNQNYSVLDALQYAIQTDLVNNNQNVLPVISISYGNCEQQYTQAEIEQYVGLGQQANSQGQTIVASSGDDGSADCDGLVNNVQETAATLGLAVDFPGSSPYTTAAGGTSFEADINSPAQYWDEAGNYTTSQGATNGSALSYIPEGAWNDSPTLAAAQANGGLGAGGGGISEVFNANPNYSVAASSPPTPSLAGTGLSYLAAKPFWQTGPGVPNDGARDVPDVALSADPDHDGYVMCTEETNNSGAITIPSCASPTQYPYTDANGSGTIYGGTSVSAPQFAAMITLWNQAAGYTISSAHGGGVGNANYILYALAQTSPSVFHDVVASSNQATNSNAVDCQQGTPSCVPDPNNSGNYIMAGYDVGAGYDQATGLGSVDVAAMSAVWGSASPAGESFNPNTGNPAPDFQIVGNPAQVSLIPSGSATATIDSTALDGFTGTVTLTCAGQSAHGISCNFGGQPSATVTPGATLGASGSSATLTIVAAATATPSLQYPRIFPHGMPPSQQQQPWQRLAGGGIAFAALCMMGLPAQRRRFLSRFGRQANWMAMSLLLLIVCVGATIGCSSTSSAAGLNIAPPNPGPTPNISNYVTVTATAGTDVHSIAITYNLQ